MNAIQTAKYKQTKKQADYLANRHGVICLIGLAAGKRLTPVEYMVYQKLDL